MNLGKNPAVVLVINFIIGALVSHGIVDPESQSEIAEAASEFVGLTIITATTGVSLWQLVHQKKLDSDLQRQKAAQTSEVTVTSTTATEPPVVTIKDVTPPVTENPSGLPSEMLP